MQMPTNANHDFCLCSASAYFVLNDCLALFLFVLLTIPRCCRVHPTSRCAASATARCRSWTTTRRRTAHSTCSRTKRCGRASSSSREFPCAALLTHSLPFLAFFSSLSPCHSVGPFSGMRTQPAHKTTRAHAHLQSITLPFFLLLLLHPLSPAHTCTALVHSHRAVFPLLLSLAGAGRPSRSFTSTASSSAAATS